MQTERTAAATIAETASWRDPVMRARLANAYVRAGGDDDQQTQR